MSFWELIEILKNASIDNLYKLSNRGIESFRFEDGNDYEYKIWFKFFLAYCQKIDIPESFIAFFSTRKVCIVIFTEGGWALSRLKNAETSNIW